MGAWRFWWASTRRFYQHWGSYVALIFGTNLAISYLAIPFFNWALEMLLKSQSVAYVSYTNIGSIMVNHPLAAVGMLGLLFALIILVYWQFAFLLLGITNILNGRQMTVRAVIRETSHSLHQTSLSTFGFFIGYFIVILPFGSYLFTTPLLNKAQIPAFIVTFLMDKPWMAVALVVFYILAGYVGLRLMTLLPLMIIDQMPWRAAVKQSWHRSRHQVWRYLWHSLVILGLVTLFVTVLYGALYGAQLYFDTTNFGMAAATVNLFLMEIVTEIIICYTTALFMMLIVGCYRQDLSLPMRTTLRFNEPPRLKRLTRTGVILGLIIVSAGMVAFNLAYLNGLEMSKPLMIAHRGVDDGNGVQNTLPSLIKTSREKPDYVEMDIQVTKDHKFIVMHDNSLKALAGVNKKPSQLTLKQLQKITVRENGHKAKIPSFDQYFNTAIKHHQKLLVEIKTSSAYTQQDTKNFIKWYGKKLLANHAQVHTLSYKVMRDLKKFDSKQFVNYIMPYNLTFPYTKANGYTMEVTTLNDRFVDKADNNHQVVYAWDIDTTDQMDQMMFMGVDGIITDNLREMQAEVKRNTDHPGYAKLLLTFMNDLDLTANN